MPPPSHAAQDKNAHEDLALLTHAVRAGGDIALKYYQTDYKRWSKEGGSPVTEADLAVNSYLCETLTAARPDYGWLSEESADDEARLAKSHVFVVDPIDGTIAFLKSRPHFTICAAVVVDGRPVCGAIFNPATDEMYAARMGRGATRNGTPIHAAMRAGLEGCAMLGDRTQLTAAPWPPMHVQNRNSVAYRVALVADGSADASVSLTGKRDWDLQPPQHPAGQPGSGQSGIACRDCRIVAALEAPRIAARANSESSCLNPSSFCISCSAAS